MLFHIRSEIILKGESFFDLWVCDQKGPAIQDKKSIQRIEMLMIKTCCMFVEGLLISRQFKGFHNFYPFHDCYKFVKITGSKKGSSGP